MKSVKVLGVYGGSSGRDRLLSKHLADLLKAVQDAGAACERIDLEEKLDLLRNAEPSKKFVSPAAEELADNVLWADVLIVATPVHWRLPSLLTTAFIHHERNRSRPWYAHH
jgi:NAD(P)H-dependent FMN reductase